MHDVSAYEDAVYLADSFSFEAADEGTVSEPNGVSNGSADGGTFNEPDERSNELYTVDKPDRTADRCTNKSSLQRSSRPNSQLSNSLRLFRIK